MTVFTLRRQTFDDGVLDEDWYYPHVFFSKEEARDYITTSIIDNSQYGRWFIYSHSESERRHLCHVVYHYSDGANGEYPA